MRKRILVLLPAALVLLAATIVWADVGPPVKVTLLGDPRPAVRGEVFEGVLALEFDGNLEVSGFGMEGKSWIETTLNAPASRLGQKGDRIEVAFSARSGDPDEPLVITFDAGGFPYRKILDLSEANYLRTQRPEPTVTVTDKPAISGKRAPGLFGPETGGFGQIDRSSKATIRIHGTFGYIREDGVFVGAHSMRIRVYDEDPGAGNDDLLGAGWTDAYGNYEIFVESADAVDTPDIYVLYDTYNLKIEVVDPTYESLYVWASGTTPDFTGTDLNLGSLIPGSEANQPAVHLHTTTTRVFNFCYYDAGYSPPSINVLWPDGATGAWYNSAGIHMSSGLEWQEQVPAHEYGHYWDDYYSVIEPFDYCNGWCDNPSCGHCIWCEESESIAYMEGWANFFSDVSTHTFFDEYGLMPMYQMEFEDIQSCGSYGVHDAEITEGHCAAMLHDLCDDAFDDDPEYPDWYDQTTLWIEEIFMTADQDNPDGPIDFLEKFNARYPALKEWVWQSGMNNGYDTDTDMPGTVSGLTSTSHSTSGDSPDPTIDFTWNRAPDDVSGVDGYGIFVYSAPSNPSATVDLGNVTSYTTPSLTPGTYYFNIRAKDRSGKWAISYASYGPITIREAEPADITYYEHSGWDYVLVPSSTTGATYSAATVSPTLPGAYTSTYWSIYGRNVGDETTSTGFHGNLYTDGIYTAGVSWGTIAAGGLFAGINMGPLNFRGGRHVASFYYDDFDAISEADETNNHWGHPFIWTPWTLTPDSYYSINAYPDAEGGWDHVVDGSILWYNCDGTRFSSSDWWNAVIVWAEDDAVDYDVRIHEPSTGSENGFAGNLAASYRGGGGLLDGVIVNRNMVGINDYDVGMLNRFGGDCSYHIEHVTSGSLSFGDSVTVTLSTNKMLQLYEFYVGSSDTGYVSITVDVDPADGPLTALWLDETFEIGSLASYDAADVTDATGRARLDLHIPETGYNGLVVYREPVDGRSAIDYTVEIDVTPPDILCLQPVGWHSPLVPRSAADGTPSSVPLPSVLLGNETQTYINIANRNDSPTTATSVYARVLVDNAQILGLTWPTISGNTDRFFNYGTALYVDGGRHTMSVRYDPLETIEEIHEDNNIYGEQYVWMPWEASAGTSVARNYPPAMTSGWDDMPVGPYFYNCDGLRLGHQSWWMGMVILPLTDTDDFSLRVHDAAVDAKNGFDLNYAFSGWGAGQTDFVLVNYNTVAVANKDFGVLNYGGTGDYLLEASAATILGIPVSGDQYGPYTMPDDQLLDLYEVTLGPGFYVIKLQNESGAVDWGLSVYGSMNDYVAKSGNLDGGMSWLNGPGGNESIAFEVVDGGYHCLAVWKVGPDGENQSGSYVLNMWDELTAIDDETPTADMTSLTSIRPNPFNPRTTIVYHLQREVPVELRVYDVQGSLVRTLVSESQPAGSHEAVWDGTDDQGQRVASDVYLLRLRAADVNQMKKLVLLK